MTKNRPSDVPEAAGGRVAHSRPRRPFQCAQARKRRYEERQAAFRTKFVFSVGSIYAIVLAYAAYVVQQPYDAYPSALARAARISPVFIVPVVAAVIYRSVRALFGAMMRHTDKRINKVNERSEKIVQGLKDDMKFDRTEKLLRKYDREWMNVSNGGTGKGSNGSLSDAGSDRSDEIPAAEYNNKAAMTTPVNAGMGAKRGDKSNGPPMSLSKKLMMSTVGGASIKLSGALAQLWTLTADTVIGDDPVLLRSLKNAEIHAQTLTEENSRLREKLERYENEYGIIYDMNVGRGGESEEDDRRDDARADERDGGRDGLGDGGGDVHDLLAAEDCTGSEEDDGTDEEEVVEMVVTHEDDVDADPYLLAGNGPDSDDQDPQQDGRDESGDEAELEPEPEPVPAPRRSRRARRRA